MIAVQYELKKIWDIKTTNRTDKYFSRPILDFSLLYKNDFDLSEYDESFSLNLFLYFSVTLFFFLTVFI
jgi:hypothetical protein